MAEHERIQLNLRVTKETSQRLDEIVTYYEQNTKFGRVYKADVLTDIIEKAYAAMLKQNSFKKQF
ncbi:hypothetical protein [Bacillus sp. Marseille-P3661]|uniref:hypothetical protein n=1 Tax=Bacillus sp. Marseille-P3661 TaxID=1936234 RepID=UPI000C8453D8|nr:hypothetical protein [Bacillus sp. Marseille-P3661]